MTPVSPRRRNTHWNAISALIAAFIGLLALCVSAYTANIQRQQARAQVWTHLIVAVSDTEQSLLVIDKGVGPARVGSLRVYVDGHAQPDWKHVLAALGLTLVTGFSQSTVSNNVIAANEKVEMFKLASEKDWQALRRERPRLKLRTCYCSVLDDCRVHDERSASRADADTTVATCERDTEAEFSD